MGEISRLHEADIVPFKPNDATDVSNEFNNIINNGVNDNFNQGTAAVYGGILPFSVVHNANRLDDLDDLIGNGSVPALDTRITQNETDIGELVAADVLIEGRLDDLENKTFLEIDASSHTIATGDEQTIRVIYSGNCSIASGDADDFDLGEEFTITATDETSRYVVLNMDSSFGDFSLDNIYITAYDSVRIRVASYDGGTNNFWHVTITPIPVARIVWTPAAGSHTVSTSLYPDRISGIWASVSSTDVITITMPLLLYVHERGYSWTAALRASGSSNVTIKEHASDGGATIKSIDGVDAWSGQIVPGSATEWYAIGS
jgi:hypothetical protein